MYNLIWYFIYALHNVFLYLLEQLQQLQLNLHYSYKKQSTEYVSMHYNLHIT